MLLSICRNMKAGIGMTFWTGEAFNGGKEYVQANIPDVLPLYIKAGSILPLAEAKQYAMEYPDRELELRIYGGADASFLWYEDEGDPTVTKRSLLASSDGVEGGRADIDYRDA